MRDNGEALDLFRGAGGWSVACQRLGITDYGVETMKEANLTATAAGHKTLFEDVWEGDESDLYHEGRIASPPCQTFSQAGKGAGRKALDDVLSLIPQVGRMSLPELRARGELLGDERTALVLTPLWYTLKGGAEWAAWEQVPTVLPVWEACAEVLREYGFNVWTGNLQAEQYGVPQTRKRAILIASRSREVDMPKPTHSRYYSRSPEKLDEGVLPWVSIAEALGYSRDGLSLQSNYSVGGDTSTRGERSLDEPASTVTSKSMRWVVAAGITGEGRPRSIDTPAPAITTKGTAYWLDRAEDWRAPEQNAPDSVRVSVHEAGILQSFPADYPWCGAKGKQYLQVGNAIPPLLAEAVLREATGL